MPLNRHWELGPPRGTTFPPPYQRHRTMREVLDQELIARRDAADLARYRATLRKAPLTKEENDHDQAR
jgi:hypothetical protein